MKGRHGLADLEAALSGDSSDRVSIRSVMEAMGPATWGTSFLLFGAASLVPGVAPLFGVALCLMAASLASGYERPWLPESIQRWKTSRIGLIKGIRRLKSPLDWLETILRRRGEVFLGGAMTRLAGLAVLLDAILVVLPVPFGNTAPSIAIIVLALGLTMRDGYAVLGGLILTLAALLIDAVLLWAGWQAVSSLFDWFMQADMP
jgi:hypothetical protein